MLVGEVMTAPVVTVPDTASIRQAIRTLYEHNITAAPVVDHQGRMVGVVSEMDLLRREFGTDPRAFARPVAAPQAPSPRRVTEVMTEVMTQKVRTAHENSDVAELAEMMIATGIKSVPVLYGDTLVGMVSRRDLMRALAHSDARIRDDVLSAIETLLPGSADWDVLVEDGEVKLRQGTGGPTDKVAEVIAQTVPGVSRVTVLPAEPPS